MLQEDKTKILERIAQEWNEAGVDYAVAHGLEKYPTSLGRDLDIVVSSEHQKKSFSFLVSILNNQGYSVAVDKKPWAWWIVGVGNFSGEIRAIEVDFIRYMNWGPALLITSPHASYKKGPFKIDPWSSFSKRILIQVLGGNIDKFRHKMNELCLNEEERAIIKQKLPEYLDSTLSQKLIEAIEDKNLEVLKNLRPKLKRQFLLKTLIRHPLSSFGMVFRWIRNELVLSVFANPGAPNVAIVGPDGVGKSTVLNIVRKELKAKLPFTNITLRHWRPGLLPPLSRLIKGHTDETPEAVIPRRTPGKFMLIRLFYYFIDFVLGWHVKDKPMLAKLNMILYDRCALDMAVDPVRYGLSSARGAESLWRLAPKPDMVILLYDDPVRIHRRKPELQVEEIDRQLKKWLVYYQKGWVNAVIKVDASPEVIAGRIQHLVVEAFIQKNRAAALK